MLRRDALARVRLNRLKAAGGCGRCSRASFYGFSIMFKGVHRADLNALHLHAESVAKASRANGRFATHRAVALRDPGKYLLTLYHSPGFKLRSEK
jgi:hypothetical protein